MGNHYHVLMQTREPNRSDGMRQLNGVYAQSFNRRHGRVGHLFQGRHGALLVQSDERLLTECRYIVRNPLRTRRPVDPVLWPWSSHRATLGLEPVPRFLDVDGLLAFFGPTKAVARERYRDFVAEEDMPPPAHPLVRGDDEFVVRHVSAVPPNPEFPRRFGVAPPPLADLLASERDGEAIAAANRCGYSMRQIATHLGCGVATVSRRIAAYECALDQVRT